MPSNFQVTMSVWAPDRFTVGFAPSVNVRSVVEQSAAPGSHVAIWVNETELITPDTPVARVQLAAFHVTSLADQVVAPTAGGVNDAAFACTLIRSCLVADASTIRSMVTVAALAAVLLAMLPTLNDTLAGTTMRACSLTVAVSSVVWLVSGSVTVVWALATPALAATRRIENDARMD